MGDPMNPMSQGAYAVAASIAAANAAAAAGQTAAASYATQQAPGAPSYATQQAQYATYTGGVNAGFGPPVLNQVYEAPLAADAHVMGPQIVTQPATMAASGAPVTLPPVVQHTVIGQAQAHYGDVTGIPVDQASQYGQLAPMMHYSSATGATGPWQGESHSGAAQAPMPPRSFVVYNNQQTEHAGSPAAHVQHEAAAHSMAPAAGYAGAPVAHSSMTAPAAAWSAAGPSYAMPGAAMAQPQAPVGHFGAPAAAPLAAGPPGEVAVECIYAAGVDVNTLPPQGRRAVLPLNEAGSWVIGRLYQPELFAAVIPVEAKRVLVSRTHCTITWQSHTLQICNLSPNALLLDGEPLMHNQSAALRPEAQMTFGSPEGPLLVFRFHLQPGGSAGSPQAAQLQAPAHLAGAAAATGSPCAAAPGVAPGVGLGASSPSGARAQCQLSVVSAIKREPEFLMALDLEAKVIPVPSDGAVRVGRQHQNGFFERLLGNECPYLTCISRSHFEVMPLDNVSGEPHSFRLTNLSGNPIRIGVNQLFQGQQEVVRAPCAIEILGTSYAGEVPVVVAALYLGVCGGGGGGGGASASAAAAVPGAPQGAQAQWASPQQLQQQQPPGQALCAVECTYASGCDLASLAPQARRAAVPAGGIGRQFQPGFFEALLGSDRDQIRFVSRSHLSVQSSPALPQNGFLLTNLSCNAVVVDQARISQGQQASARLGSMIDFVAEVPGAAAPPSVFLRLQLVAADPAAQAPFGGEGGMPPAQHLGAGLAAAAVRCGGGFAGQ